MAKAVKAGQGSDQSRTPITSEAGGRASQRERGENRADSAVSNLPKTLSTTGLAADTDHQDLVVVGTRPLPWSPNVYTSGRAA